MIHLDLKNWTDWRLKPRSPGHRKHLQLSNTVTMTTNNSGDRSGNSILLRSTSKLRNPHAHSVMYSESAMCQAFNTHTSFTPNHENWGSEKKADQGYTTRVRLSQESNPSLSNSRTYVPFTEPCPLSHLDSNSLFPPILAFNFLLITSVPYFTVETLLLGEENEILSETEVLGFPWWSSD